MDIPVQGTGQGTQTNTPLGSKSTGSVEDDLKFLRTPEAGVVDKPEEKEEEENEEETSEEESEEKDEEESEEESEDEPEESEEDEEEPEEETAGGLVTAKDLKAKFPDIFKKVPELRAVIYREQQFSKIFVDPREAQQASQDADNFRTIEADLVGGKSKPLFEALKGIKGAKFNELAAGILPALKDVDEQVYMKMLAVPFKQLLRSAYAHGVAKKDKNLEASAQHLHAFVFDNYDLNDKTEFESAIEDKKPNQEEEKYKRKLEEIDARDHQSAKNEIDKDWLKGVHDSFFDKFDPDGVFTKWAKEKMFEDCVKQLNEQFVADARFKKSIDALWSQARASGYNTDSKSRIVNAALARAKQIIPQLRSKIRGEALAKEKRTDPQKQLKVVKREGQQRKEKPSTKDTSKMSDLDIIRSA
jgi:hypothetical protein